ncbi:cupin domain-containing protein [Calorimonas adulescens]|uniref:Cupin domain-containing protein n=1 Tax=Calorimonas adulescens TaxID=2606906 RepID=A0A5D8QBZ9_9THEO|nr:cupin domain-containing protein [Calorimonas adulescens]TZE81326.1 cupin domain-containing protein [Calorimonas adulescens]
MKSIVKNPSEVAWVKNPIHKETYLKTILDEDDNENILVRLARIMPGGEIVPHTHENQETFYFLEGEGLALVNGERIRVKEGQLVNAPAGCEHGVINDTDKEILLYAVFSPLK